MLQFQRYSVACAFLLQQFDPHVVIQPLPNGTCVKLFETSSRVFRNLTSRPRGNTQAVLVPSAFSGEPRDFYLGVVHAESKRAYQNYFYKMQVSGDRVGNCRACWQSAAFSLLCFVPHILGYPYKCGVC